MAFRATLVSFGEDAVATPFLGHQFTEIAIRQPDGADASNPSAISISSRDRIIEATTGRDVAVVRRKLTDLSLSIDFVDAATKARIERLYHDGREIYFCPNVGPSTRWSFPLQRGLADFAGRKTLSNTRSGPAYFWDETERVFRSWAATVSAIDFNGRWTRYLRGQEGHQNKAAYPHPTSTNHGWSATTGSVAFTYTEDILSPVLQQRTVTNQKGVVLCYAAGGVDVDIKHDSAATLSTTNAVVASVCAAWQGMASFLLSPTTGGAIAHVRHIQGDGKFQLVKLGGANTAAKNQFRISITFWNTATKKQAMIIGPTFIGNSLSPSSAPPIEDWNTGIVVTDYITSTDSNEHALTDFTFSAFIRWTSYEAGIILMGSGAPFQFSKTAYDALFLTYTGAASPMIWSNVQTTIGAAGGWAVGDWVHLVLRGSDAGGLEIFINGIPHASNGTKEWEPTDYGNQMRLAWFTPSGGVSHARMDAVAWTDAEILDHFHTYFDDRGRGVVEPVFGKVFQISELEFNPRGSSSPMQYIGAMTLSELGPNDDFAGMIRQEGDV